MNRFIYFFSVLASLDKYLFSLVSEYGSFIYFFLFFVIFAETGLVVTPFLPGDSLLFASGAISGKDVLSPWFLSLICFSAAILGDALNYSIGRFIGPKIFHSENSWFFNKNHLLRAQNFYEKYGAKTIVIARFVPIIRTFAPFVAGIGKMNYSRFAVYNIFGGFLWTFSFIFGGFFFGNLPFVEKNFSLFIFLIILVSLLPGVIEFLRERKKSSAA